MNTKIDKVIVTNLTALRAKYSDAAMARILHSIDGLIAAAERRGLRSRMICLDDAKAMKRLDAEPVVRAASCRQNKVAMDGIYRALAPDYLMILGATDIVPHQNLTNPLFDPSPALDNDRAAFGDLPYACEAPYSRKPQNFLGPTRVVGRLPDITGGMDPAYLVRLLKTAAFYKAVPTSRYRSYFALTAQKWQVSSAHSLIQVFGTAADLKSSPPHSNRWRSASLGRLSHFINCHGLPDDFQFYGQPLHGKPTFPVALDSLSIDRKMAEGIVAAAECCYGGQLYDPVKAGNKPGICNTYLANKAYGFFASTTIAYSTMDAKNPTDYADIMCEYFLQSVLRGASLGRAALEARQKYARMRSPLDPYDLKTLSQFNLYADPSVAPVGPSSRPSSDSAKLREMQADWTAERAERSDRRRVLFRIGLGLARTEPQSHPTSERPSSSVKDALYKRAREFGIKPLKTLPFIVRHPTASVRAMPKGLGDRRLSRYYVVFGHPKARMRRTSGRVIDIVALIAREVGGQLVSGVRIVSK
jgi:hypothetical protein